MLALAGTACLAIGCWLMLLPVGAELLDMPTRCRYPRARAIGGYLLATAGLIALVLSADARATPATPAAPQARAAAVHIPPASARYRHQVQQIVGEVWGLEGSPARLAAQIHQESLWRPTVTSWAGAEGMAQFMPRTGRWLAKKFPDLGPYDPWDPEWALRAAAVYDAYLLARADGATACADWAFTLSAYNGGETRLRRERAAAAHAGKDGDRWFGAAAAYRARGPSAWRENRHYVTRILIELEPAYLAAGWPGRAVCA